MSEPTPHTRNLLDIVCAVLDGYGHRYLEIDHSTVHLSIGHSQGIYPAYIIADDELDLVQCLCFYGSRIPIDRRLEVADALTRMNWGGVLGNFDMDFSDGEVRFRIGMNVQGGLLSERMVQN